MENGWMDGCPLCLTFKLACASFAKSNQISQAAIHKITNLMLKSHHTDRSNPKEAGNKSTQVFQLNPAQALDFWIHTVHPFSVPLCAWHDTLSIKFCLYYSLFKTVWFLVIVCSHVFAYWVVIQALDLMIECTEESLKQTKLLIMRLIPAGLKVSVVCCWWAVQTLMLHKYLAVPTQFVCVSVCVVLIKDLLTSLRWVLHAGGCE